MIELIEKNKQRYTCDDINLCFNYLKQAKNKLRKATNTLRNLNMNVLFNNFDRESIADDLLFFSAIEKDSAQWSANDIFLYHITSGRDAETELDV